MPELTCHSGRGWGPAARSRAGFASASCADTRAGGSGSDIPASAFIDTRAGAGGHPSARLCQEEEEAFAEPPGSPVVRILSVSSRIASCGVGCLSLAEAMVKQFVGFCHVLLECYWFFPITRVLWLKLNFVDSPRMLSMGIGVVQLLILRTRREDECGVTDALAHADLESSNLIVRH
ncbi:hypothetical protein EJB05_30420, partial [Eragrostis curvula]